MSIQGYPKSVNATGNADGNTTKKERCTVAQEFLDYLEALACLAARIEKRVEDQLAIVCVSSNPSTCEEKSATEREYPPLFAEMRSKAKTIKAALLGIESVLDRCEL